VFVAAVSLGLAAAFVQWLRSCWRLRSYSWTALRYWTFFFAKPALLAAGVAALSGWGRSGAGLPWRTPGAMWCLRAVSREFQPDR
jgi:hypothetical protein